MLNTGTPWGGPTYTDMLKKHTKKSAKMGKNKHQNLSSFRGPAQEMRLVPGEGALFIINDHKVIINEYNNYEPAKRSSDFASCFFPFLSKDIYAHGFI